MSRIYVMQDGEIVGTVPRPKGPPHPIHQFAPECRFGNPLVSFRTTDFRTQEFVTNDGWSKEVRLVADPMLGMGDLEDIRGFKPSSK